MKRKNKLILGATFLLVPTVIYATVTQVSNLDVWSNTQATNNVASASAVVGYGNHASGKSLSVGGHNYTHNLALVAGHSNNVRNLSGAVGWQNDVNYAAVGEYPRCSFATGFSNTILAEYSFTSGYNNDVTGNRAAALGEGLLVTKNNACAVGTFNEDKDNIRLAVGNGTSGNRSNALEVYQNGDVIINKAQGDIGMGGFGN